MTPVTSVAVDGRHRRKQGNRDAVVGALIALFREGVYEPGAADIAARAGISVRSLFRYFADVDDLVRAAVEHQLAAIAPYRVPADPSAPTAARIAALVATRVRMYEAVGPTARAARLFAHRHPVIAARLRDVRAGLRHEVAELFAPELDARADRDDLLPAIDALGAFETFELLRSGRGMTRARVAACLEVALAALLARDTAGQP